MQRTSDINVVETRPLPSPTALLAELPKTEGHADFVTRSRRDIHRLIFTDDRRFLLIVGPCSIHDLKAGRDYAGRLAELAREVSDRMLIVMRVYFEKPRTTIGWTGLIMDPHLDGTHDIATGLRTARTFLREVLDLGLPTATELLDPITPQYIADLICWSAIGARTAESQTHRQMASGLSMPVGYKNSTEGNLQVAIEAMQSAQSPHSFLGIDSVGQTAIIKTRGNHWGHLILRGGKSGPNYDAASVAKAADMMRKANLPAVIMIDCSHANSGKKWQNQEKVWRDAVRQRIEGNPSIIGLLVESNLLEGNQPFTSDASKLRYGVSITDECMGWDKTEELLLETHRVLKERT